MQIRILVHNQSEFYIACKHDVTVIEINIQQGFQAVFDLFAIFYQYI